MINLRRAVVFFDLEATGTAPERDRIVEVALLRREPDGQEKTFSSLVNPGVPIPPEATAIHKITDEMVRGQPSFVQVASKILDFIGDCDLAAILVRGACMQFYHPRLMVECGQNPEPTLDQMVDFCLAALARGAPSLQSDASAPARSGLRLAAAS